MGGGMRWIKKSIVIKWCPISGYIYHHKRVCSKNCKPLVCWCYSNMKPFGINTKPTEIRSDHIKGGLQQLKEEMIKRGHLK